LPHTRHLLSLNRTPPTATYTLSLHDALPISHVRAEIARRQGAAGLTHPVTIVAVTKGFGPDAVVAARAAGLTDLGENRVQEALRSEEHTSELQSPYDLVCRLLLEKKKNNKNT